MRTTRTYGAFFCALTAATIGANTQAEVPLRTESRTTLVAPTEVPDGATVYYVAAGPPDVQVTFTSDAPVERIVGTSSGVVGYLVANDNAEDGSSPIHSGAFRMAIGSFDTGLPMRNGHLVSDRWMNAFVYPDVSFELTSFDNAEVVKRDDEQGFVTWSGDIAGEMTVKGITEPFSTPARVTFIDLGDNRMIRGGGKKIAIRCTYPIGLADFEIHGGDIIMGVRFANEISLDQFLLLSPNSPNQQLARMNERDGDERWTKLFAMRNYHDLESNTDAANEIAEEIIATYTDAGDFLNTLANMLLGFQPPNLPLAKKAASLAVEATNSEDAMSLDTLAEVHFRLGDSRSALEIQRKAAEHLEGVPERAQQGIKENLARYEEAAG